MASYFIVFNWLLTIKLSSKDTRFPFTAEEMRRGLPFVQKIAAHKNIPQHF